MVLLDIDSVTTVLDTWMDFNDGIFQVISWWSVYLTVYGFAGLYRPGWVGLVFLWRYGSWMRRIVMLWHYWGRE